MNPQRPTRYIPDEGEEVSTAVLMALSEAKEGDLTEGEWTLYDAINPDALNRLFDEQKDRSMIKLEFDIHEAIVVIRENGGVTIDIRDFENRPND